MEEMLGLDGSEKGVKGTALGSTLAVAWAEENELRERKRDWGVQALVVKKKLVQNLLPAVLPDKVLIFPLNNPHFSQKYLKKDREGNFIIP